MNWEELVSFIEKEIPNAEFYSEKYTISGGHDFLYTINFVWGDKRIAIDYDITDIKVYSEGGCYGWNHMFLYIPEIKKGFFGTKKVYKSKLISPRFDSLLYRTALIMPKEHSYRVKKAIVNEIKKREEKILEEIK